MKKNLFLSCILSLALLDVSAQVSIGVQGGAVFSKPKSSFTSEVVPQLSLSATGRTGYHAGIIADVPLGEGGFRLMPELNYVAKGGRASTELGYQTPVGGNLQVGIDFESMVKYLELPLSLAYSAPVGDHFFVLGAGPYVAVGLNGNSKLKISSNNGDVEELEESVKFGSVENEMRRLDYGANLMAGFIHGSGMMIKANYSLGLADLSNGSDPSFRNRYFGLSLVYFFLKGGR